MNSPQPASMKSAPDSPPALTVVIPFFNEQDNIEPLLREVETILEPVCAYEIVAVDDGSTDATAATLQRLSSSLARLRTVRLKQNCGQSVALAHGIHSARAPLIATLDGDGQNPPSEIPVLLEVYNASRMPRIIVGWRQKRDDNLLRLLSSHLANGFRRKLLQDDCPDTGCGLKVFERHMFLSLPLFNHMHRFLPALFRRAGCQVINVPVAHRPRVAGVSKYGVHNRLWTGLIDLAGVYWLLRRQCPIESEPHHA